MGTLAGALALAAELTAAGVPATCDPGALRTMLPAVLIGPPALGPPHTGAGPTATWTLLAVAADPLGGLTSWEQLDELLDRLVELAHVDRATPTTYTAGGDPLPAYSLTLTGS